MLSRFLTIIIVISSNDFNDFRSKKIYSQLMGISPRRCRWNKLNILFQLDKSGNHLITHAIGACDRKKNIPNCKTYESYLQVEIVKIEKKIEYFCLAKISWWILTSFQINYPKLILILTCRSKSLELWNAWASFEVESMRTNIFVFILFFLYSTIDSYRP